MNLDYTIFKNFNKNKDIKFYTYSNCPISSRIKNNVFWEKHLHDIFEKFINERSIVIEGGCHIGTHTLKSKPIDVQLTTIDDLKLEKLDFIKLDIEGYEQFAIMGGLETIKKFKPVITLESWLNHKGQININETKKRYLNLIDLGYEFHHIWGPDFLFIPK